MTVSSPNSQRPELPPGAARKGGLTVAAAMTPEERRQRARHAHLASSISTIVKRAHELSPEQVALVRVALDRVEGREP